MVSAENCGKYMVYNLLRPEHKTGAHFVTHNGDNASKSKYLGNSDVRTRVWNHAEKVTGFKE